LKIDLIAPTHLPARRANTIQVMKMAQALAALNHEVRVIVPGAPLDEEGNTITWEKLAHYYGLRLRFPVEWLPAHPSLRRYDYGWLAVSRARQRGAQLIYTRLPQAAALASLQGVPTVYELHDLPQSRMSRWLVRSCLRGSGKRRLVVITRSLANDLAGCCGTPAAQPFTLVAPDGVDLARFDRLPSPEEARRSLAPVFTAGLERFTAGYTGHLYPGRGADLILEVAARLPEMNFLLAGGEPQDIERLREQVSARRLANLCLAGFVPNTDLPSYQAACDVLLMPYQRQVAASSGGDIGRYLSPMKLFEYLACGRPILSSDLPVLREVLSEKNAVLLPPDDPGAWVDALRQLQASQSTRQRLAEEARRTAEKFTWEARAGRLLEGL
jgi:glycosyltransferase involved in cell wall biosynthesis